MEGGGFALRLGLRLVKGLGEEVARRLVGARGNGYREAADVSRRTGLGERALAALAAAAAFGSLDLGRREGWWAVERIKGRPLPLFAAADESDRGPDPAVALPPAAPGEEIAADYRSVGLSLRGHPVALLREAVGAGITWSGALEGVRAGARIAVIGVVLVRQRPRTAKGVIFLTLEDMEGIVNVVVWSRVFRRFRLEVQGARLMRVEGRVESSGSVVHVIAERIVDLTEWLVRLADGTAGGEGTAALSGEPGGSLPGTEPGRPEPPPSPERVAPPLPFARLPLSGAARPRAAFAALRSPRASAKPASARLDALPAEDRASRASLRAELRASRSVPRRHSGRRPRVRLRPRRRTGPEPPRGAGKNLSGSAPSLSLSLQQTLYDERGPPSDRPGCIFGSITAGV